MATKKSTRKTTKTTTPWGWIVATLILGLLVVGLILNSITGVKVSTVRSDLADLQEQVNATSTEVPATPIAPASTVVAPSTPTNAPIVQNDSVMWLIGGRQDDQKKGYEYIAKAEESLITSGTPLQPFFSQVTRDGFYNSLNLGAQHEVLNDGVQFLVVGDTAFIMPRETSAKVPFWSISWIQYVAGKGVMICVDDAGAPGDWIGACAGESMWVTTSMPLSQLLVSDLFAPWAKQFVDTQSAHEGKIFNDKIEVLKIFRQ